MAAAVSGLSPVIITVLMPMRRSSAEALFDAAFDDVFEIDDAQRRLPFGDDQRRAAALGDVFDGVADFAVHVAALAAARIDRWRRRPLCGFARPSKSTPLMRVWAENGMKFAPSSWMLRPRRPYFSLAKTTMLRPSGVSSASEASWAAVGQVADVHALAGMNSTAWRLPSVIVPVLSSSSTSTSPAASTARPDMAITLA